jgi:hypothetical protein
MDYGARWYIRRMVDSHKLALNALVWAGVITDMHVMIYSELISAHSH